MKATELLLGMALAIAGCQGETTDSGEEGETGGPAGPTADDPCGACAPGGYAVDCGYLWGLGEFTVCGINQDNAEYLCDSTWAGIVVSSPSDDCSYPAQPWEPGLDIHPDPAGSGVIVIDSALLDRIEERPQDIYLDATRLDWDSDGAVVVATVGELASALGLAEGDVLIDIDGYLFVEVLDTVRLYPELRSADVLTLALERRGQRMTIRYRIE